MIIIITIYISFSFSNRKTRARLRIYGQGTLRVNTSVTTTTRRIWWNGFWTHLASNSRVHRRWQRIWRWKTHGFHIYRYICQWSKSNWCSEKFHQTIRENRIAAGRFISVDLFVLRTAQRTWQWCRCSAHGSIELQRNFFRSVPFKWSIWNESRYKLLGRFQLIFYMILNLRKTTTTLICIHIYLAPRKHRCNSVLCTKPRSPMDILVGRSL